MKTIVISVCVLAFLIFSYFYYVNNANKLSSRRIGKKLKFLDVDKDVTVETIDNLSLNDVITYFKSLSLKKGRDIPFIVNANNEEVRTFFSFIDPESNFDKGIYLLVATYNEESETIENYKFFSVESIDDGLKEAIGDEPLVVLN